MHNGARDVKIQQRIAALHLNMHRLAHFTAHDIHRVVQGGGSHIQIVHLKENIPFQQAGLFGGAAAEHAGDGAKHGDVGGGNLDADAGVLAAVILPHFRVFFGVVVVGIGVAQTGQQAALGAFQHGVGIGLNVVIFLHNLRKLVQRCVTFQPVIFRFGDGDGILGHAGRFGRGGGGVGQKRTAREQQGHQQQTERKPAMEFQGFHRLTPQ